MCTEMNNCAVSFVPKTPTILDQDSRKSSIVFTRRTQSLKVYCLPHIHYKYVKMINFYIMMNEPL